MLQCGRSWWPCIHSPLLLLQLQLLLKGNLQQLQAKLLDSTPSSRGSSHRAQQLGCSTGLLSLNSSSSKESAMLLLLQANPLVATCCQL